MIASIQLPDFSGDVAISKINSRHHLP